jgi:hypothetical protein
MKRLVICFIALIVSVAPAAGAGVTLVIRDGLVSLDAQDATIRQILTEWARVGRTQVVNLERIAAVPTTLQFENVPEKQALEIILRSVPGYVAAPRATVVQGGSMYDRILIMATTTQVAARPQPAPPPPGLPGFTPGVTQLRAQPVGVMPEPGAEPPDPRTDPAIAAAAAAGLVAIPGAAPPTFSPTVAAPTTTGTSAPAATTAPNNPFAPTGVARPGLPTPPAPANAPLMPPRPPQADR